MELMPVVIDADNAFGLPVQDIDDGVALALALAAPEVHLLAVTACAGNCRASLSAEISRRMLAEAGRGDVPVGWGRESPLVRDREPHHLFLEGKSAGKERGFWGASVESPQGEVNAEGIPAWDIMAEAARKFPGEVVFIMQGALTNLALALRRHPDILPLVKKVIHMGGAFEPWKKGQLAPVWSTPDIRDEAWRDVLRFNTDYDPEASAEVFASGIPVTIVPVNVTSHVFLRPLGLERIRQEGGRFREYLCREAEPWIRWSMEVRRLPGAHMHDPLALALAFEPGLCRYDTMVVDNERLLSENGGWLLREGNGPEVQVAVDVDAVRFEKILVSRLSGI